MNYTLFDDASRADLLPFTYTRPVADIRCGIFTMRERWAFLLKGAATQATGTLTEPYLQAVFPLNDGGDNLYINGGVFGNVELADAICGLENGHKLTKEGMLLAARIGGAGTTLSIFRDVAEQLTEHGYDGDVYRLKNTWDIFSLNDRALREDFRLLTKGRMSAPIPANVVVSGAENLFIEAGAVVYPGCIINAVAGPVYVGKDAEVLEGTMIRGPFASLEHSVVKMGAKIYGATTIGPDCKVGGEINNMVMFANSNKGHDGYLGNAVIGEWCNLGADTNCSNLKNNYDEVKVWSGNYKKLVPTGLTFCGLLMGDHSKCGINTMFNTGTVVGVSCNIFGGGFPGKYVPSFSWGGREGMEVYKLDKAMETANRMMGRRGRHLTEPEVAMYKYLYDNSTK